MIQRLTIVLLLICTWPHPASAAVVRGCVVDESGVPLAGTQVEAAADTMAEEVAADAKGCYSLDVPPGGYLLSASRPGFVSAQLAVETGDRAETNIVLRRLPFSEEVTVVAETARKSPTDASGVISLQSRLIQATPAEVLEKVPGLIATQHSGSGKANQYYLRGFSLDHGTDVAIFADGVPVNLPTHAHGQGYADVNFLIPELIGEVRYGKGSSVERGGDFAAVGSVDLRSTSSWPTREVRLERGRDGWRRLLVVWPHTSSRGAFVWALESVQNDGPWDNPERLRKLNVFARYTGTGADDTVWGFTGTAHHSTWNATHQVPQRAVRSGAISRYASLDPTDGGDGHRYSLSFFWQRAAGNRELDITAYVVESKLNLFSNFTYFLRDPDRGDQFEQFDDRLYAGGRIAYSAPVKLGRWESTVSTGVVTRHDHLRGVELHETYRRARLRTVSNAAGEQSSAGGFARASIHLTPGLEVTAGTRRDLFRFGLANAARNQSIESSHVAFSYAPSRTMSLYAHSGSGFHSNDGRRIHHDGQSLLTRTRGSEAGVHLTFHRGEASAALFRIDTEDELVFVGDAGTTESRGRARRSGVELHGTWVVSERLQLHGQVASSSARFRDDEAGHRIPGSPGVIASCEATGRFGSSHFAVRYRHVARRPLSEDGGVHSTPSDLVTMSLSRPMTDRWTLELTALNVLNSAANEIDYLYTSRLSHEPAGVDDVHVHPFAPRSLRVGVRRSF